MASPSRICCIGAGYVGGADAVVHSSVTWLNLIWDCLFLRSHHI